MQFDGLARTVGMARRSTLKGLLGMSLGFGLGQLAEDESSARKRRKKGKRKGKKKGKGKGKGNKGNPPQTCQPDCTNRSCGDNGCGGRCGICETGFTCTESEGGSSCQQNGCQPQCNGKTCGSNGCGGSCGTCPSGQTCTGGTCSCATPCGGTCCSAGQICVGNQCWADSEEMAFLSRINQYRAENGRAALSLNTKLGRASELHSQDQAAGDFSGHTGSNGSTPEQRITAQGYQYSWSGENVFWSIPDGSANAAFTWWKGSPDHNANMLNSNFTEIGIGRAHRAANNRWFWTTNFGRPA